MKKAILFSVLALTLLAAGCGTKSTYIATPGAKAINQADGFKVGQVNDLTGFHVDDFNLKDAMTAAMEAALAKQGLTGAGYSVNVNILAYYPGNAFLRWLMPGAGATQLTVEAMIMDKKGELAAKIPVDRHISAGGGYTVGAYKYVVEEVAQEIAAVIKNPAKAKGKPSGQAEQKNTYGL